MFTPPFSDSDFHTDDHESDDIIETELLQAVTTQNIDEVQVLVKRGENQENAQGLTSLAVAIELNNLERQDIC